MPEALIKSFMFILHYILIEGVGLLDTGHLLKRGIY